jgi:hypothetical protein
MCSKKGSHFHLHGITGRASSIVFKLQVSDSIAISWAWAKYYSKNITLPTVINTGTDRLNKCQSGFNHEGICVYVKNQTHLRYAPSNQNLDSYPIRRTRRPNDDVTWCPPF